MMNNSVSLFARITRLHAPGNMYRNRNPPLMVKMPLSKAWLYLKTRWAQ